MCRPATCRQCGRATWAGCGQHVDTVMAPVPTALRCACERAPAKGASARKRWSLFGR